MKIKITDNVTIGGAIHKKGSVADLKKEHAETLVEGGFAEEHSGKKEPRADNAPELLTPEQLSDRYDAMTKPELGKVIADAKKVKEGAPEFAVAQQVLEHCKALIAQ